MPRVDLAQRVAARRRRLTIAVFGTVTATVLGVGVLVATMPDATATSPRPAAERSAGSTTAPRSGGSRAGGAAPAEARLQDQRLSDRSALTAAEGSWLPQTSSKREGTTVDGTYWDADQIWSAFQSTSAQHPEARLVWSGDWGSFRQGGYWVTVIDQRFTTAAQANAWCDGQGYAADQCYAKRLTTSGGYDGNTVQRR